MSTGPESQANVNLVEETRKQINRLFEEVARLAEMDIPPGDFYSEFLKRILHALAAPAGAIWTRTAQGNLQLQFQINMKNVGLDANEDGRASHDELLRQAVMNPRAINLPPHSSMGPQGQGPAPGNPTPYLLLLVPIVVDNQVAGLLEVWQAPDRHPSAVPGFIQFMARMAEMATRYIRNNMLRTMVGQQQLWVQLEAFARSIHGSLNPVEVGYLIVNEARRLVECDRISVGVRYAKKCEVEAISGADVVEKRSNLVQLMRALFDAVIAWGEKLVYAGSKDETLPPDVLKALDNYLAESNSKLLVVLPMKDERQTTDEKVVKPARSAMMMECFEPQVSPEQLLARLEVIARHSTPALYNAVEHRRIPFRFIWMPIAKVQEGLGGKTKAIITLSLIGVLILLGVLVFVPYPLKMDAKGQVLPVVRRFVYSPSEGRAEAFAVNPNDQVDPGQPLVLMYDDTLRQKLTGLKREVAGLQGQIDADNAALNNNSAPLSPQDKARVTSERNQKYVTMLGKEAERKSLADLTHSESQPGHEGYFWIHAPEFPPNVPSGAKWTVLNADFRENLIGRHVKPSDPLLRLGYKEGDWEVELKIPQKHMGQVSRAFDALALSRKEQMAELLDQDRNSRKDALVALLAQSRDAGRVKPEMYTDLAAEAEKDGGRLTSPRLVEFLNAESRQGVRGESVKGLLNAADLRQRLELDKGRIQDDALVKFLRDMRHQALVTALDQDHDAGRLPDDKYAALRRQANELGARMLDAGLVEFLTKDSAAEKQKALKLSELLAPRELDVDILVKMEPTRVWKGRLNFLEVASDANPHKDDNNESEPVVIARVRLTGPNIDEKSEDLTKIAPALLTSNTEVAAKIRCGYHRMGYSLFYGVWEFFYEKVVFFF